VFASRPGVETASAGLAPDAEEPVTPDHLDQADIPDDYDFMQPDLVALLEKKVGPFL
jgi:predicted protein tyrosine phosphatase